MIETRFNTTRRSTPATSTPCWKAPSTAARMPNRNSATANDPAVSAVRVFFRNRLLATRCKYFIVASRAPRLDSLRRPSYDAVAARSERRRCARREPGKEAPHGGKILARAPRGAPVAELRWPRVGPARSAAVRGRLRRVPADADPSRQGPAGG